jgi:hypothetical protein
MIRILLVSLLASPLILVPLILFLGSKVHRALFLAAFSGFMFLGVLILTRAENVYFPLDLQFLSTPLYLSFSRTPALLFIATLLTGLMLLAAHFRLLSRWQAILGILSLPFGFLAFFSGQFMLRYMALEAVGLISALTAINTPSERQQYRRFGLVFALLRLGDIGLWSAILLLNKHARSLDISTMITSAESLPLPEIGWVLGGFLLAVMVKTAIWPFDRWLRCTAAGKNQMPHWIPAFLMPTLGLYLLYRIRPILQSQISLQVSTALLILGLLLVILAASVFRRASYNRFTLFNSLAGSMAIFLTAFVPGQVLPFYFLGLLGFRLVLWFEQRLPGRLRTWAAPGWFLLLHAGMIPFLPKAPLMILILWGIMTLLTTWWGSAFQAPSQNRDVAFAPWISTSLQRMRRWENNIWLSLADALQSAAGGLYRWVEIRIFSYGFTRASDAFVRIADWLQVGLEENLERLWKGLGHKLLALSKATLHQLEDPQGDKMTDFSENLIQSLDEQEQQEGFKSFRWDLIWVPVFLLVILLFLVLIQKG